MKIQAVVTGDIVGSSRLSPARREALPRVIHEGSRLLRREFPNLIPFDIDVFRGDSWQMLISSPPDALRALLTFRAFLLSRVRDDGVDTRSAVGIGAVDFTGERVSEGDGEAYRLSGRALDDMPSGRRMGISLPAERSAHEELCQAAVALTDEIVQQWTSRQAHAVMESLCGRTQRQIAEAWKPEPVTQQTVAKHLSRAGWSAIETALSAWEHSPALHGDRPTGSLARHGTPAHSAR